jgi:hypothetical protein
VIRYLGTSEIGALFGVPGATVVKWRTRYAGWHGCPEPDAMTDRTAGWLPEREAEWRTWEATRPGQTSGLQRGRKVPR